MVFAVDISKDRTVQLVADNVEVTENGFGGQIVTFYRYEDDLKAKDENGHTYANFNNKVNVGSYYLDKIKGYRIVSGLSDEEFVLINRDMFFGSMEYKYEGDDDDLEEIPT